MTPLGSGLRDPTQNGDAEGRVPKYLYRYLTGDGILHTLNDRVIRMSPYSRMNDPRESSRWETSRQLSAVGNLTNEKLRQRIDDVLHRCARLLALTCDRAPQPEAQSHLFHRGWAKALLSHKAFSLLRELLAEFGAT
jgi:hypothetical protein